MKARPELTPGQRKTLTGSLNLEVSMQELAAQFGISRAALAAIEARALRKLRAELERRGFKVDDLS